MKHAREDYNRIQDPAGLIPEDEPVFLLRGQDALAAATVRDWAGRVAYHGGDQKLVDMAREHAKAMDAWPVKKLPDLPVDAQKNVVESGGYKDGEAPALVIGADPCRERPNAETALQLAAQAWCTPETSGKEMDVTLATAFADILEKWLDTWASERCNTAFYRNLLDQVAEHLWPESYRDDEGHMHLKPVWLRVPGIVARLAAKQAAHHKLFFFDAGRNCTDQG